MRVFGVLATVVILAGCTVPTLIDDETRIMPECGGFGGSPVEISIPESDAPVLRIVFLSAMEEYEILCSYAWPSEQTVQWQGRLEQTAHLLPDRIVEIRVYREESMVRIEAPFDLTAGRLVLLPDWPALVFNKEGVEVTRSEVLPGRTGLEHVYEARHDLPYFGVHERIAFDVNSTWNKGAQVAVDVEAPHAHGSGIRLRLVSPSGKEAWNATMEFPDERRRELKTNEIGKWELVIDTQKAPEAGKFDVQLLFRY